MTAEASLPGEEERSMPGDGQAGDRSEGVGSGASVPVNPAFYVSHGLRDEARHVVFQFRTGCRILREQVLTAFAKMKANPPQRCPVVWDSVVYTGDGLRCQWKIPSKLMTVWSLFHRVIMHLPGASAGGAWGGRPCERTRPGFLKPRPGLEPWWRSRAAG